MKKYTKIFNVLLVLMFIVLVISMLGTVLISNDSSIIDALSKNVLKKSDTVDEQNDLTIKIKTLGMLENGDFKDTKYVKYKDIFDEKQEATGRYANVTPDGKIRWDIKETKKYEDAPITKEMMDKITLDGKKIKLPMKFEELEPNLKSLSKADFTKFAEDMEVISITDKKTKYGVDVYIHEKKGKLRHVALDIIKNYEFILSTYINDDNNTIIGLQNKYLDTFSPKEMKVDDIGIGNTFNEMYAKFGKPTKIKVNNSDILPYISATYHIGEYTIDFRHDYSFSRIKGSKKLDIAPKPNVITDISIYIGTPSIIPI